MVDEVIDPDLYDAIERTILQAGPDADSKAIKALLPNALYGQIACVRAALRRDEDAAPAGESDGEPSER